MKVLRLALLLTLMVMWGCVSGIRGANYTADNIDVSTGESTAVVEGQPDAETPCSVMQPARANRVTVDAGPVSLSIACFTYYLSAPNYARAKRSWVSYMDFDAEAGHGYRIEPKLSRKGQNSVEHVSLVDLLTNEIVARAPAEAGRTFNYDVVASNIEWAVIYCVGCVFDDRSFIVLPPAAVRLSSQWFTTRFFHTFKDVEAELEFDAKPGHTYFVQRATNPIEEFASAPDNADCAMVVDWTKDREFVTCVQIDWPETEDGVRLSGNVSTSDETVTVYCSGCLILLDGLYTQMTFDAGKVDVQAKSPFGGGVLFSFDAVAGHSYVIRANSMNPKINSYIFAPVWLEDWSDGRKLIGKQYQ
jgi:hypothetical protein